MVKYVATMTKKSCLKMAAIVRDGTADDITKAVRRLANRTPWNPEKGKANQWKWHLKRLASWLENGSDPGDCPFEIFKEGNKKLSFLSFSTLSTATCPGAGPCLTYCYSYRAWRYPAAFCRQIQNTILTRSRAGLLAIRAELAKQVGKGHRKLRLYVDGDFATKNDVRFWFSTIKEMPTLLAYGYSKSWRLLTGYAGEYPTNYVLNISNGSRYEDDADLKAAVERLPITRGHFIGVELDGKYAKGFGRFDDAGMHREVREKLKERFPGQPVFSCTGKCGPCASEQHACGSNKFDGVLIGIGIH